MYRGVPSGVTYLSVFGEMIGILGIGGLSTISSLRNMSISKPANYDLLCLDCKKSILSMSKAKLYNISYDENDFENLKSIPSRVVYTEKTMIKNSPLPSKASVKFQTETFDNASLVKHIVHSSKPIHRRTKNGRLVPKLTDFLSSSDLKLAEGQNIIGGPTLNQGTRTQKRLKFLERPRAVNYSSLLKRYKFRLTQKLLWLRIENPSEEKFPLLQYTSYFQPEVQHQITRAWWKRH